MTRHHAPLMLCVLTLAAGLTACGHPSSPPASDTSASATLPAVIIGATVADPTSATPSPSTVPPRPDTQAIDTAAMEGVRAVEAVDTRADTTPRDALLHAAGWLTPSFMARIRAGPATASAQWSSWVAHHAIVTATTRKGSDEHPPDTPAVAYRQVLLDLTTRGAGDWTPPTTTEVVFVTLRPVHGLWRIDDLRTG